MDDKEKYRTEIEVRMSKFNKTIEEIVNKKKQREVWIPDIQIEGLLQKKENARGRLKALEQSDDSGWEKIKSELDQLVEGIDEDLRRAMAYFG
jgi:hypothetical protein